MERRIIWVGCAAALSFGCLTGPEPEIERETMAVRAVNGVALNGLGLNGIKLNGIKLNGIKLNGIKLNGLDLAGVTLGGLQPTEAERRGIDARLLNPELDPEAACSLARHLVWYAFAPGDRRVVICEEGDQARVYLEEGALGVWASFGDLDLDSTEARDGAQALVDTLCAAGFNNREQAVSWRGRRGPPLFGVIPTTTEERSAFNQREGLFWAEVDWQTGAFSCNVALRQDGHGDSGSYLRVVHERACGDLDSCPWFEYQFHPDVTEMGGGSAHCALLDDTEGGVDCYDQPNDFDALAFESGYGGGDPTPAGEPLAFGRTVYLDYHYMEQDPPEEPTPPPYEGDYGETYGSDDDGSGSSQPPNSGGYY
jgi:hypothetical protein